MTACPYADDGVVYEVTLIAHGAICGLPLVGRFASPALERSFWMMETVEHESFIDVNPAHVLHVTPAHGERYSEFVAQYGEAD